MLLGNHEFQFLISFFFELCYDPLSFLYLRSLWYIIFVLGTPVSTRAKGYIPVRRRKGQYSTKIWSMVHCLTTLLMVYLTLHGTSTACWRKRKHQAQRRVQRRTNPRFHVRNKQYTYVASRRTALRLMRATPASAPTHAGIKIAVQDDTFYDAHESLPQNADCLCTVAPHHRRATQPAVTNFDTDSVPICIDTGASYCSTTSTNDFLPGTKVRCEITVKGLGEQQATSKGTVRWRFQDDVGQQHSFDIPDVLHLPHLPHRLLSPQHWAQTFQKGAHCDTRGDFLRLEWGSGRYKRTIHFGCNNIAMIHTAPGYCEYAAAKQKNEPLNKETGRPTVCFPVQVYDDDYTTEDFPDVTHFDTEAERSERSASVDAQPETMRHTDPIRVAPNCINTEAIQPIQEVRPIVIDFMDNEQAAPQQRPELPIDDPRTELMRWHRRLGHMPFSKLQHMARRNILPGRLAIIDPPTCAACIYGTQTRRPWRVKGQQNKIRIAQHPGECVSVDTLESTTLGFIGQLKGTLTTERYQYATVFVDHFSRISFVHLHRTNHATEVLAGKKGFEQWARNMHVTIENYHADNGRFADNLWLADIARNNQTITYCGVNAHWMNGIAEKTDSGPLRLGSNQPD